MSLLYAECGSMSWYGVCIVQCVQLDAVWLNTLHSVFGQIYFPAIRCNVSYYVPEHK
jgi:hypothetical protein